LVPGELKVSLLDDQRLAIRHLLRSPGFTAAAVLMLALGIGATTAVFSIVEGVLLRPLPFPRPERLVALTDVLEGPGITGNGEQGVTAPDIQNYIRGTRSFDGLGGYQQSRYELTGIGEPAMVNAARMSSGVFQALAVQPLMGRWFTAAEDEQKQAVVVLSYSAWRDRMSGDANILRKKIFLNRRPYVVIGVMPPSFEFPLLSGHLSQSELWVPLRLSDYELTTLAGTWQFLMVGRLKPGVTPTQAADDAAAIAAQTVREHPTAMGAYKMHPVVRPLRDETVESARPLLRTLFLAVVVVLLIACANLAGLLLVRTIRRQREIAVRFALGARASTLLRQALAESLTLSISGGVLGLALAAVALRIGVNALPDSMPRIGDIRLDWGVAGLALLLAVLTGVLCGLAPAFAAIRTNVNNALKEGGRTGTTGSSHGRLRSTLVVVEIAVALILLAASGLLLRSFAKMRHVDLGFSPDHTIIASYGLPAKQYVTQAQIDGFNRELLRRLRELPGVEAAGMTSILPATDTDTSSPFVADGYALSLEGHDLATPVVVEGDYFRAMGIPLVRGRYLNPADNATSQLVAVVNRRLAEQSWPGEDPIGKRIRLGTPQMTTRWLTVVGVVAEVKGGSPDGPAEQQFYENVDQVLPASGPMGSPADVFGYAGEIVVRSAMQPERMENALRTTVRSIDPQLPLAHVQTMTETVSEIEAPRRFNTAVLSAFAAAAVALAVLGVYSVMAFSVALRVQEIAIRMALGSRRGGILRLVLISGAKLAVLGCAIGILGALAASRLLESFLFGTSPFDPLVLTAAAGLLIVLVLAASLPPALRAASINPTRALRGE
jgi:putative ABC transport system permease protein